MAQKIYFFVHDNQYQTKRIFAEQLVAALERLGKSVRIIAPKDGALQAEDLELLRSHPPDLTCSFNCILPLESGDFLWDFLQVPHAFINLDPVIYTQVFTQSPYILIPCVDRFDVRFLEASGFARTLFFPHATDISLFSKEPPSDYSYDVVLLGSCYDHEALRRRWCAELSLGLVSVVESAIEIIQSDRKIHFLQAIAEVLQSTNTSTEGVDISTLCVYVDYYMRGWDRLQLLRRIDKVNIHLFGEVHEWTDYASGGWEAYAKDLQNVQLHPPTDYNSALEIMRTSKICLNSCPQFTYGGHERVMNGLALGSLVLSNWNRFLAEGFSEDSAVLLYGAAPWDEINSEISRYLNDETARKAAVQRGQAVVKESHTWDSRAQQLLDAAELHFPS